MEMDDSDKRKLSFKVADSYTLTISQFGSDFELATFDGTNKPEDTEHWRGSVCQGFDKLYQGRCIAYNKKALSADFLTVLEAHSGKDAEVTVKDIAIADSKLKVTLLKTDGSVFELEETLDI
jgi:hypothetical protein